MNPRQRLPPAQRLCRKCSPTCCPLAPEGRYDLAQNKDGSWYAVQGDSVYLLDNDRLPSLLDAAGVQLRVFDAKPLYHIALGHGELARPLCLMASWPPTY